MVISKRNINAVLVTARLDEDLKGSGAILEHNSIEIFYYHFYT